MGMLGDMGNLFTGVANLGERLVPTDTKVSGSGNSKVTGTSTNTVNQDAKETKQLELDYTAIQRIIADVLGGPQGLASIFAGEKNSGIFNSSVAAQASGDIAAKLVGELAKLTAKETVVGKQKGRTTARSAQETEQRTNEVANKEGPLEKLGDLFGF